MKPNITYEQALEKASPRLQKLMQASVELLRKSEPLMLKYDPEDGGWCGFSGGKDSQALYHIAQLSGVKFKAFFSPTSVDPPQVIRFIRKEYPEVEFTRLKESIYTAFKRLKVLPTQRVRWCCALFKEKGGENKVTLTGVRKAESVKRSKRKEVEVSNYKFSGNLEEFEEYSEKRIKRIAKNLNQDQFSDVKESEIRCINGKDKIIINPIIDWTDKDVWEFLNDVMEVPHCELYDPPYNQTRIGCIGCPMASTKNQRKQLDMWPHVREKWIKAIMEVRKETYNEMLATPPPQHPQRQLLGADIKQTLSRQRLADWGGAKVLSKITPKGLEEAKNTKELGENIGVKSEDNVNFRIASVGIARPLARYTTSRRKERLRNTLLIGG